MGEKLDLLRGKYEMNSFAAKVMTAPLGKIHMFSVGQAGFIIKSKSGRLLGIDLYLSECVEGLEGNMGFKRLLPKIMEADELEFDCIIATHAHYDHFDIHAIPQLMSNNHTALYASVNCQTEVNRLCLESRRITYVKPKERCQCGEFLLEFVPCDHGGSAPDALGVIVTVDGRKIYEAGDTCLRFDYVEELKKKGVFDVLIAPINGTYGNLNEMECAQFVGELKPKLSIPCHYGMFALHEGNPGKFYEIMKKKYPDCPVLLLTMGEGLVME